MLGNSHSSVRLGILQSVKRGWGKKKVSDTESAGSENASATVGTPVRAAVGGVLETGCVPGSAGVCGTMAVGTSGELTPQWVVQAAWISM